MKSHRTYYKTLQKTEKVLLSENNITKAILTATYFYVPTVHSKKSDANETFIVGLYLEDEEVDSLGDIFDLYSKKDENISQEKDMVENIFDSNATQIIDVNLTKKDSIEEGDVNITSKSDYQITLNGKKPLAIKKLKADDSRLKHLSFVTEWNTYALVTFKHVESMRLKLLFESTQYGKGILYFSKVAKYVFSKKSI